MDAELDSAIANLYGGPLDNFVERRNTLAKELRAAGNKEGAAAVKELRKPSRLAWALDITAQTNRDAIAALDTALTDTVDAHAGRGDVRDAMANLRTAVRELAGQTAYFSERNGLRLDAALVVNALHAVVGNADSLQQLRRGTLVEVPEAGGLDFLATLPTPAPPAPPAPRSPSAKAPTPAKAAAPKRREDEQAAREAAQRKATAVAEARKRSQLAEQALRAAEKKLREAEAEVERARAAAESAAAQLKEVEHNDL